MESIYAWLVILLLSPLGIALLILAVAHQIKKFFPYKGLETNPLISTALIISFVHFVLFILNYKGGLGLIYIAGSFFIFLPFILILSVIGLMRAIKARSTLWILLGILSLAPPLFFVLNSWIFEQ